MSTLVDAAQRIAQPESQSEKHQYDRGELRIQGNTLVVGNSIFPIANISTVTFTDLRKPVPKIVWVTLMIGVICLPMGGGATTAGFVLLIISLYFYMVYFNSRSDADYALAVRMNGGNTALVGSNDEDFLKAIALELYEVIELERASNTTFNLDQKVIVDSITGSTVTITGIDGDIVNNVARI